MVTDSTGAVLGTQQAGNLERVSRQPSWRAHQRWHGRGLKQGLGAEGSEPLQHGVLPTPETLVLVQRPLAQICIPHSVAIHP